MISHYRRCGHSTATMPHYHLTEHHIVCKQSGIIADLYIYIIRQNRNLSLKSTTEEPVLYETFWIRSKYTRWWYYEGVFVFAENKSIKDFAYPNPVFEFHFFST